jgi:hypothetical protein
MNFFGLSTKRNPPLMITYNYDTARRFLTPTPMLPKMNLGNDRLAILV